MKKVMWNYAPQHYMKRYMSTISFYTHLFLL